MPKKEIEAGHYLYFMSAARDFAMGAKDYWRLGGRIGDAWSMGKSFEPK